jgi:DNA ligase-1
MRLADLVATSGAVAASPGRLDKIARLSALLTEVPPAELDIAIAFLGGAPRQGRLGIGESVLRAVRATRPSAEPQLELSDVDAVFERIKTVAGGGVAEVRARLVADLLAQATGDEQDFLVRLMAGELRQGALEGVLVEAVARAAGVPPALIRRAAMLEGALAPVARAALLSGGSALEGLMVRPFRPVRPMLAEPALDTEAALEIVGEASFEYKLDGARIQAHKVHDEVRVYSRSLRDVTAAVPEVVDTVRAMPPRSLVLDGEVIALRDDGLPHPFQVTMRRFGRRLDVDRLRTTLPLRAAFFDCLYLEGAPLIDEPLSRRIEALTGVAADSQVPRLVTAVPAEAAAFLARAIEAGHEGVMVKAVGAPYAAGRRGRAWLKVKRPHTLDLVVLGAEWGSGRRRGRLSNLHLGARDTERGGFVMLGKTFKGLTDEMLAWQTTRLLELEIARDGHVVFVRPELVVEVAFDDIQESPQYPGRLALRFARVKRYRPDKAAAESDTFATIQSLYRQMTGLAPPLR